LLTRRFPHNGSHSRSDRLYTSTRHDLVARLGEPNVVQQAQVDVVCRLVVAISELRADEPQYHKRLAKLNADLAAANRYLFGPDYGSKRQRRVRPLSELIAEAEAKDIA
jgi:hypothetical protein